MSEGWFQELFSEVEELSKSPSAFRTSLKSEDQILKHFLKALRLEDSKEVKNILNLLPRFGFFKNIFSEYVWCTPSFAKHMGFEHPEDLLGKSDLCFPWSLDMALHFQAADETVLLSGLPTVKREAWMFDHSTHDLILDLHRYPVFDQKGEIVGVFGVGKESMRLNPWFLSASQSQVPLCN